MTLPSQTAPSSLLSPSSCAVVSATAPVVAQHADEITARFYSNMFAAHPELLRVFNQGNQATGEQSKALAGSVVAYAVQLIDPNAPSFAHVMRRIAYKHMSLGVRAEQYIVVGHYLLEAVGQVLGEAVTPEVAAAWEEVYWLFAVQLIGGEARLYQHAAVDPAQPTRPYRIVKTIEETSDVISLVLDPPMAARYQRSCPGNTFRCSSTCPTVIASRGSTPSPRLRWAHGSRSRFGGCSARTAHLTVGSPPICTTKPRLATSWT
jgi:nitric oxide dioxygenase